MTVFVTWAFPATGSSATRTMPDRLSDIVNVKDWGATGNGVTDDSAAVQDAIDYLTVTKGTGGKVFFPPGTYKCTAAGVVVVGSSVDVGVQLLGSGKGNTTITDAVIRGSTTSYDNLERVQALYAGGGIVLTRANAAISACALSGNPCVNTLAGNGASIHDCSMFGASALAANQTTQDDAGSDTSTIAFLLGSHTTVTNCRTNSCWGIAYAISGTGVSLYACSAENPRVAVRLGWASSVEVPAIGCSVQNFQTERCNTSLDIYNAQGCFVAGNALTASVGPPVEAAISNAVWSTPSSTVEVTTTLDHNLPAGTYPLQLVGMNPGIYSPTLGFITATRTSSVKFTYPLSPSSAPSAFVSGNWSYPCQYGIRCREVSECTIASNEMPSCQVSVASVDLDYDGFAAHSNNVFIGATTPFGWIIPSDKRNLAGWSFQMSGDLGTASYSFNTTANPAGQMVFANLPGQTGVLQPGPIEGQEYSIIDSSIASSGNFAAIVSSGNGVNKVKLRYDGTDWRISG